MKIVRIITAPLFWSFVVVMWCLNLFDDAWPELDDWI